MAEIVKARCRSFSRKDEMSTAWYDRGGPESVSAGIETGVARDAAMAFLTTVGKCRVIGITEDYEQGRRTVNVYYWSETDDAAEVASEK